MKMRKYFSLYVLIVILFYSAPAISGRADIIGNSSYSISNGIATLRLDQIKNNTTNIVTGSLYLTLRMSQGSNPSTTGYNVARTSISSPQITTGQLSPGQSFTDLVQYATFSAPPNGSYYVHLYVSEYPDLNTALDVVTFPNIYTIPSSGGGSNDTIGTASPISLDANINGEINPATDIDFYRFTVTNSGEYVLQTSGSLDTTGTLYNSSGTQIAFDDDGGTSTNFMITQTLSPGTYYISVQSFSNSSTGSYQLTVNSPSGGGGGGSNINSGITISGTVNWVASGGNLHILIDHVINSRSTSTGSLVIEVWAVHQSGGTSGYKLGSLNIGSMSANSRISGISEFVSYTPPADGTYYSSVIIKETTSSGEYLVARRNSTSTETFSGGGGGGGGGGQLSLELLILLLGIAFLVNIRKSIRQT